MSSLAFYKPLVIVLLIMALFIAVGLILPAFAEETKLTGWLWYGAPEAYYQAQIFESPDVSESCKHSLARACVMTGLEGVIMILPEGEPHGYNGKGCTNQTHEYYHLMGYAENEIPMGCPNYVEYTK